MSYKNRVIEDMIELLYDATIPMGSDYIVKYSHNTITIRNKFADFRSQYDNRGFFMNSRQRAFCSKFDKKIRELIYHWFNGINDDGDLYDYRLRILRVPFFSRKYFPT